MLNNMNKIELQNSSSNNIHKTMRKSQKQNIELPILPKNIKLELLSKQQSIIKPKLHRILYSPIPSPRQSSNLTLLQSLLTKKNYDDIKDEMKEKQIQQFLRETKKMLFEKEQRSKNRVGKQAQIRYYQNYRKLDKIMCKKKMAVIGTPLPPIDQDPSTLILQATQNLNVLPCCIGFIKNKGQSNIVDLKGQKFGDQYIKAISAGLKQSKMIQSCVFSNNRLTDQGVSQIFRNLTNQIIKLDLSFNRIAKIDKKFLSILTQPQSRLEHLNLQSNLLSDKSSAILLQTAVASKHLKYLNLRNNLLTKQSAQNISQLVLRTTNLQQLYIGMNRIGGGEGALAILDALEENRTIRVFDFCMNKLGSQYNGNCNCNNYSFNNNNNNVSNNSMSSTDPYKIAKLIGQIIQTNKLLVHVDFSDNGFNEQQSKIISEKLDKNKRIYGFHFGGNYGYVDSKGFLKVQNKKITSLHSIIRKNINSYNIVFPRDATSMQPSKFTNVCWICQGWYQQTFKFIVPQPSADGKNFVYIHFDFQEFQPRLINLTETKVKYKTMVPPKRYRYFFTWNHLQFTDTVQTFATTSKSITSHHERSPSNHHNNNNHELTQAKLEMPAIYTYEMNHEPVTFKVENVSCRNGKPKKLVNNWDEIVVEVLPREEGLINKKEKKVWEYKDSLWAKQWKLQDESLTKNCFEKDWKSSKLTGIIKNQIQQDKSKQILYKHYKLIKQLYKHYSSWFPFNSDIWAVSGNAFTEFCYLAKIIGKQMPLTIIDLTFITTNSISGYEYKGNPLVPERGLVRFQFMEMIVRLAQQKYRKNGLAENILGSIVNMMKDHIQPLQQNPICSSQKWRLEKYFCQQNDILIKKYRPIFTDIYKKNSKAKVKPGNKPFMCLAQFKSIIQRVGLAGSLVLQRDIFISYNCSMMTQVDQLQNQRFIRMMEIEFIEAVARCAYILPDSCRVEDIFGGRTPFYAKFQWVIHQLKTLCSEQIKNTFGDYVSLFNKSQDD